MSQQSNRKNDALERRLTQNEASSQILCEYRRKTFAIAYPLVTLTWIFAYAWSDALCPIAHFFSDAAFHLPTDFGPGAPKYKHTTRRLTSEIYKRPLNFKIRLEIDNDYN